MQLVKHILKRIIKEQDGYNNSKDKLFIILTYLYKKNISANTSKSLKYNELIKYALIRYAILLLNKEINDEKRELKFYKLAIEKYELNITIDSKICFNDKFTILQEIIKNYQDITCLDTISSIVDRAIWWGDADYEYYNDLYYIIKNKITKLSFKNI